MKEFEPSRDFAARVMKEIRVYESRQGAELRLSEKVLYSRPLRYALSGGGIFLGIFITPIVCI